MPAAIAADPARSCPPPALTLVPALILDLLYRGLTCLAAPAVHLLLRRRTARGKEDPLRRGERLGRTACPRPAGPLIWLHAASVGESLAVLPLIGRLLARDPALSILVTTGTVTSADLMARRLPPRAFHQYVPVDLPAAVERFLDHWRPDLALWVESEFWPNLLGGVRRRRIPCALVNARLSAGSFARWRRVPKTVRHLLSGFTLALAQTAVEAERLRRLGLADTRCVGNLKYSAEPLPCDDAELARLADALTGRAVWAFASSHPGEEEIAAGLDPVLRAARPDLLTILAPRHPERGDAIAALLAARGLRVARRSAGESPAADTQVWLVDTLGELGLVFRLAPIAVVGGSFTPVGGHNPIEPALLGSAVLYGPHMHNFAEVAAELEAAEGALRVHDADALGTQLSRLLADPAACRAQSQAALEVAERNRHAADRMVEALGPLLARAGIGQGAG
ncbi:3-deoxy-D-manno-octulosonic acid transferase [Oleisolibacter albus]|uniref:3-deoxy-D-manno-octulosonic acid transferase n=1 Tax=Oleisolibacter albus TaxID=2171757 RepID=UPI001EFE0733|nr:3-deoxy-D-manno-octulosonic acid transferase [Oleisolibacter albus]